MTPASPTLPASGPWPFAPGDSPFKIKGAAYQGILEYFGDKVPGGLPAVLAGAGDQRLSAFMAQPFLVSSFYDVHPLATLGRHAARLLGMTFRDYSFETSAAQMRKDVKGVYKLLLKLVSGTTAINSIAAVTRTYFNFSPTTIEKVDAHHAAMMRRQFPAALTEWYVPVAEAYCQTALQMTGAKTVEQQVSLAPEAERQYGVDLVTLRLELHWR